MRCEICEGRHRPLRLELRDPSLEYMQFWVFLFYKTDSTHKIVLLSLEPHSDNQINQHIYFNESRDIVK